VTNCTDCREMLVDFERGELDAARDAAMHEHLRTCEACRNEWHADLALVDMLKASSPELDFPTSVLARVRQAMHAEQAPSFVERLRAVLRPVVAVPVAAAILIAGGVLEVRVLLTPPPAMTGMDYVREHVAQTAGLASSDRAWSTYVLTSANAGDNSDAAASSGN